MTESKTKKRVPASVAIMLWSMMAVMLGLAAIFAYPSWKYLDSGGRTEGTVVRMMRKSSKSSTSPVVHYRVDGKEYEVIGSVSSSPPSHEPGEIVEVLYKREDPADATINSFLELWFVSALLGGFGILMLFTAIFVTLLVRRKVEV